MPVPKKRSTSLGKLGSELNRREGSIFSHRHWRSLWRSHLDLRRKRERKDEQEERSSQKTKFGQRKKLVENTCPKNQTSVPLQSKPSTLFSVQKPYDEPPRFPDRKVIPAPSTCAANVGHLPPLNRPCRFNVPLTVDCCLCRGAAADLLFAEASEVSTCLAPLEPTLRILFPT